MLANLPAASLTRPAPAAPSRTRTPAVQNLTCVSRIKSQFDFGLNTAEGCWLSHQQLPGRRAACSSSSKTLQFGKRKLHLESVQNVRVHVNSCSVEHLRTSRGSCTNCRSGVLEKRHCAFRKGEPDVLA